MDHRSQTGRNARAPIEDGDGMAGPGQIEELEVSWVRLGWVGLARWAGPAASSGGIFSCANALTLVRSANAWCIERLPRLNAAGTPQRSVPT